MPNLTDSAVTLVQLTDSHLFDNPGGRLLGMNTADSLSRVIDRVLAEQPSIDLLLATGDLSQDGSAASYRTFLRMAARIPAPLRAFPGNHDLHDPLRGIAGDSPLLEPVVDCGAWRIVLLDTAVPDAVHGHLDPTQLELLSRALDEAPERPALVCLHHHPVPIGSAWMDRIGLDNAEALFAVLDSRPQVRALLWGHVHQAFDSTRNGVRLLGSPSTCVQFEPGCDDFRIDLQAPGYRWLRLHADGSLETGVSRVDGIALDIDHSQQGY